MKRYLVFAFYHYYPAGGLGDLRMSVDEIADVILHQNLKNYDVIEIYDSKEHILYGYDWESTDLTEMVNYNE